MKKCAIIVAGGSGTRMGAPLPKQYLEIGGKPILMYTLQKFYKYSSDITLILVIPASDNELWRNLCGQYDFTVPHKVVAGGNSRFQSVKNGLSALDTDHDIVAIHDGVRPFVSRGVIQKSYEEAARSGSAIAVIPLKDSLRIIHDSGSAFQDRRNFRLVQTPQTFQVAKILKAFDTEELSIFTDDATVYEHQGWEVSLIDGNPENIKITTPEDLDYADYLLKMSTVDGL